MPPAARAAFFDLDGTLVADTSLLSFYRVHLELQHPADWSRRWEETSSRVKSRLAGTQNRAAVNRWFYATFFRGLSIPTARAAAATWFERCRARPGFFHDEVTRALARHRAVGFLIVVVTGSFREVVAPVAELLRVDHVIAAPLEEEGNRYTGRLTSEPMIGPGKRQAVRRFLTGLGIDPAGCYGYGDDPSDIPFLESVGSPVAVLSGNAPLTEHARARGWLAMRAPPSR